MFEVIETELCGSLVDLKVRDLEELVGNLEGLVESITKMMGFFEGEWAF